MARELKTRGNMTDAGNRDGNEVITEGGYNRPSYNHGKLATVLIVEI